MGVRGFTTYMSNHSHLFHEAYKLKNTYIIIDGSGVSINLYQWYTRSNDCFGGDYDNYANTVYKFFHLLKTCNVIPLILFDGGYENRKLRTVFSRMRNRIGAINRLNSETEGSICVFPLFIKELFKEIALELGIKCIRNDYESDSEIACLAGNLGCPILGYDSDFYFFDSLYIPFKKFEMKIMKVFNKESGEYEPYIPCEVYKIDKFLKYFGGLDKTNLPLLPVLLGNDYVSRSLFSVFYRHMKLKKSRIENDQQRRIKTVISWLRHETLESGISKILGRFKTRRRKFISYKLNNAMSGYLKVNSTLREYLDEWIQSSVCLKKEYNINILEIKPTFEAEQVNSESENNLSEVSSDESEEDCDFLDQLTFETESCLDSPKENDTNEDLCFYRKYRTCLLPQCFVDIKLRNTYFCVAQVEDYSEDHSHSIALNILSCIHKILTQPSTKTLICIARKGERTISKEEQPIYPENVPRFEEIQGLNQVQCRKWCFKILGIDENFENLLDNFRSDWHLFLISLLYWKINTKRKLDKSSIYSLIFCSLLLNVVDSEIGYCRSLKKLAKISVPSKKKHKGESDLPLENSVFPSGNVTYEDCSNFLKNVLNYFYMEPRMATNSKLYDVSVTSLFSEFQSCYMHIQFLNSVFNCPFRNISVCKFFNGTFLYNLTVNFRKRTHLDSYIHTLLKDCPTVLQNIEIMLKYLNSWIGEIPESESKKTRRRRRKQKKEINEEIKKEIVVEEYFLDEENKYSLLQVEHIV
ncbi:hypothetical protein WA026_007310 [Henosepilachna vigintioctopunctata]|uniref:Protein asteroid n=1 Tax=Henosepilachna vigintioctopunctata TaxID=420089 RepID=A0AAW1UVH6_9CUCU